MKILILLVSLITLNVFSNVRYCEFVELDHLRQACIDYNNDVANANNRVKIFNKKFQKVTREIAENLTDSMTFADMSINYSSDLEFSNYSRGVQAALMTMDTNYSLRMAIDEDTVLLMPWVARLNYHHQI